MSKKQKKFLRDENTKIIILSLIIGIATILITSVIMIALGCKPKNVFLFWGSSALVVGLGILFGKITGLDDGEGIAVFLLIAVILYKMGM